MLRSAFIGAVSWENRGTNDPKYCMNPVICCTALPLVGSWMLLMASRCRLLSVMPSADTQ